jgi:hypothetical protein
MALAVNLRAREYERLNSLRLLYVLLWHYSHTGEFPLERLRDR